jgi:tRNA 5-methylaminomethyl-2-thiouridine biosynthesis bifunctional protein
MTGITLKNITLRNITLRNITLRNGHPFSENYNDIYYPEQDGLGAARHVFLEPNNVTERLRESKSLVTGELGFGTGLNFVALLHEWLGSAQTCHLTFVSVEKHPLEPALLKAALESFPELSVASSMLTSAYRQLPDGFHRLSIVPGRVELILLIGEGLSSLRELDARVDIWFLDGFNPRTNQALWCFDIFSAMAALSHRETTYSTWCAAGEVRRNLQEAGFSVEKFKGFDTKRESIKGEYLAGEPIVLKEAPTSATIIGGGIAGCSIAAALSLRGIYTTLIEQSSIASGASGNRLALVMPYLSMSESNFSRFYVSGFFAALNAIDELERHNLLPSWNQCGAVQQLTSTRLKELYDLISSTEDINKLRSFAHKNIVHLGKSINTENSLFLPLAGYLSPKEYCTSLLRLAGKNLTINEHCQVASLDRHASGWLLKNSAGEVVHQSDIVVVATAWAASQFKQLDFLRLGKTRGQILNSLVLQSEATDIKNILAYSGYCTPCFEGALTTGASYTHDDTSEESPIESEQILAAFCDATNTAPALVKEHSARVSFRATTLDKLPIVGMVPNTALNASSQNLLSETPSNLFCLTGLGSRAMISSQIATAHLMSTIVGSVSPIPKSMQPSIGVDREFLRSTREKR